MSDFRRRLMMQPGSTGESPEFIEFRYDKYVDTGVKMNSDLKVSLKIKFQQANKIANIMGDYASSFFAMAINYYGDISDVYNGSKITIPNSEIKVGNVIEIVKDKNMTYIDGVLKAEHSYGHFNSNNLLIGDQSVVFNADVYNFAIWQNDVLVDEFYPFVIDGKEYFKGKHTGKLLEVKMKA